MKRLTVILSAALILGVTSTASASDSDLAGLGQKSVVSTQAYIHCTGRVGCIQAASALVRSDTRIIKYVTAHVGDTINPGTKCWKTAKRLNAFDGSRNAPWHVAQRWTAGNATHVDVANAQIAFLQRTLAVVQSC